MRVLTGFLVSFLFAGCATQPWPMENDPGVRMDEVVSEWRTMREAGAGCEDSERHDDAQVDCGRLRDALERLSVEFPHDDRIRFASAVLAYETGQRERAQFYLDTLLERAPDHARGAELRSRIAIEDGNLALAERLVERTIELRPDVPSLREAKAAVAYGAGDFVKARHALDTAERLGAPAWRLAYHRGLISEAQGERAGAERYYRDALEARPDWAAPQARIRGLWAENPTLTR